MSNACRDITTSEAASEDGTAPDRYFGFSLSQVTWGYRETFEEIIEQLLAGGHLGAHRPVVTREFFDLLNRADQGCFDYVLRQFLDALNPANRWIMDLPGIFSDLVELGAEMADSKLYYGIRFFEAFAEGRMGDSPRTVRQCLNWLRRLRPIDDGLAMALLGNYSHLIDRLQPPELERFVDAALQIHTRRPANACAFLRGELHSAEFYIQSITQECRLSDMSASLRALIKALSNVDCRIADLGELDSDDLEERGSTTLTVSEHVYLPVRFRWFDTTRANRNWYMLCGIASAAMLQERAFVCIHGHPQYRTCADLVGGQTWRTNLFQILEYTRVLRRAVRCWPGARRLLGWGLREAQSNADAPDGAEALLNAAVTGTTADAPVARLRREAESCVNCFDSAAALDEPWVEALLSCWPRLAARQMRPLAFLSDFLFPIGISEAPADQWIADLKSEARARRQADNAAPLSVPRDATGEGSGDGDEDTEEAAPRAAYVYHEWDFQQNEFLPAWCHVHQKTAEPAAQQPRDFGWGDEARKIRSIFERLRPEMARREKYLPDGDEMNCDLLLDHLVDRRREPGPPVRFYEKALVNQRDLAVMVLLDVSGSTGEELSTQTRVLDVEKQAAVILGQGLAALGDRFAVCGFSSTGREQCDFFVFKDFADVWSETSINRVMAAWPRSSTRIGPALRHAGYMLSQQAHRQRLVILVTDGKPMDQGYDPVTRYAQHDVRMACEENARRDIHTFAISTEENSLADMEIMFPRRRFVILPSIQDLPRVLPQLYLRLTLP